MVNSPLRRPYLLGGSFGGGYLSWLILILTLAYWLIPNLGSLITGHLESAQDSIEIILVYKCGTINAF